MSSRGNPSYSSSNATESTQYGSVFSAAPSGYSDYSVATQYTGYAGDDEDYNLVHNPPAGTYLLPCEFVGYGSCDVVFNFDRTEDWIEHIITRHLHDKLPAKTVCWFCDDFPCDAKVTAQGDRRMNFQYRMEHIREHIADGKTANDMRPDYHMIEHLHAHRLITDRAYNQAKGYSEMPCGSSHTTHIYPPNYVPPEREKERYHKDKIVIKEDRRRRNKGK
ncbi:hypothetical protein F4818DRAFT_436352 [Hypoxylon cercidicola]|nr:hypothetical protein F4818DRAFT_436352 [Hypoxylon cercidicola]